uniref:Nucleolar protein 6 n=1 Tax=Romanomermis culicivorax TaxID=13658 RepID=A0A915IUB4_ROMCU
LEHKCFIILYPLIPENYWKLSRFDLKISNLRFNYFFDCQEDEFGENKPTPFYNQTILKDILAVKIKTNAEIFLQNIPNINDGLKLINLFLKLRFGNNDQLNNFALCFLCFMVRNGRLQTSSSTKKQIFRSFLTSISQSNLDQNGSSLSDRQVDLEEFRRHFKVVFVDFSGFYNLCYDWNISTYSQLKRECTAALKQLNSNEIHCLTELFTRKTQFYLKFDSYFRLQFDKEQATFFEKQKLVDVANNKNLLLTNKAVEVLSRGLGSRILSIDFRIMENSTFIFGISLDEANYSNLVDRGPSADSPQAVDFRDFWGEKAEMRKFADSSICETCVWGTNETKMYGRTIIEKIVKYVSKRHLNLDESRIKFVGGDGYLSALLFRKVEPKMDKKSPFLGTGEEEFKYLSQIYDEFSQALRLLENLPLNINKISPVSTYLRRTEVQKINSLQLTLESSGKWPDDLYAVRKLKTAFYCQISAQINKQLSSMTSSARENSVLIFYKGYVFRLVISYFREVTLLKRETEDSQASKLNLEINEKPKLAGQIYSLVQKFPSYALACRFFKKWISSHMLTDYLSGELQELLVASVYLHSKPYEHARSGLTGFLRTLHILATHDWLTSPLIVNLNEEMEASQIEKIRADFLKLRPTLPPMCLVTPQDLLGIFWTKPTPTALILDRLTRLASVTLEYVEKNAFESSVNFDFQSIFRTQTEIYDVLVFLDENQITRRYLPNSSILNKGKKHTKKCKKTPKRLLKNEKKKKPPTTPFNLFPVIDYDPVEFLIRDIKEKFTNLLCFYDKYGSNTIGILFRPNSKPETEEKINEFTKNIQSIGDRMKIYFLRDHPQLEAQIFTRKIVFYQDQMISVSHDG